MFLVCKWQADVRKVIFCFHRFFDFRLLTALHEHFIRKKSKQLIAVSLWVLVGLIIENFQTKIVSLQNISVFSVNKIRKRLSQVYFGFKINNFNHFEMIFVRKWLKNKWIVSFRSRFRHHVFMICFCDVNSRTIFTSFPIQK